jgi:hypothetical protein
MTKQKFIHTKHFKTTLIRYPSKTSPVATEDNNLPGVKSRQNK